MSGPKVVRIVTLEEIQAICRCHMAEVEAAAKRLRSRARRLGMLDEKLEANLLERSQKLAQLFAESRWMELQKLASDTVVFLQAEGDQLQEKALAAAEAARSRRRRLADGARSVAEALRSAGIDVPTELHRVISGAASASEATLAEMDQQLGAALSLVPVAGADAATAKASVELAGRLGANETSSTLASWIAARVTPPTASERRLDALMAELETLEGMQAEAFSTRIAAIAQEEAASRRALLTDSLVLDVAAHVSQTRKQQEALSHLQKAKISLAGLATATAQALERRIDAALEAGQTEQAEALSREARDLVESEEKAAAAAARRRAVLGALSTLGYEVRESMQATWAQDGRVILRKPGSADYGVELGAPADASRLQVRLVGSDQPSTPRNARRDTDQETIWCGEFEQLKEELARSGSELIVERAIEAGAQAVRTVALPITSTSQVGAEAARPQLRRL